ncbi:MAG: hypothetical protein WDM91_12410 [Rhizomicrobium sp.]
MAIYGAGGFAREILGPARLQCGEAGGASGESVVFVSDIRDDLAKPLDDVRVIAFDALTGPSHRARQIVIAIADAAVRRAVAARCKAAGMRFLPALRAPTHRTAQPESNLGEGAIFCDFTMVTAANVRIGAHFHCNIYSYVAHDCVIGDFVTFAPRVCCNGNVVVEDDVYVGTGAVIKQGRPGAPLVIGKGAVIGMGAVVTKSVAPGAVVVGNPARPMPQR